MRAEAPLPAGVRQAFAALVAAVEVAVGVDVVHLVQVRLLLVLLERESARGRHEPVVPRVHDVRVHALRKGRSRLQVTRQEERLAALEPEQRLYRLLTRPRAYVPLLLLVLRVVDDVDVFWTEDFLLEIRIFSRDEVDVMRGQTQAPEGLFVHAAVVVGVWRVDVHLDVDGQRRLQRVSVKRILWRLLSLL